MSFRVPGVSCEHCRSAIRDQVGALDGVESVDVDLEAKTVAVNGPSLDEPAIVAAIADAGYDVA
jgi:copper ion binding protein